MCYYVVGVVPDGAVVAGGVMAAGILKLRMAPFAEVSVTSPPMT